MGLVSLVIPMPAPTLICAKKKCTLCLGRLGQSQNVLGDNLIIAVFFISHPSKNNNKK